MHRRGWPAVDARISTSSLGGDFEDSTAATKNGARVSEVDDREHNSRENKKKKKGGCQRREASELGGNADRAIATSLLRLETSPDTSSLLSSHLERSLLRRYRLFSAFRYFRVQQCSARCQLHFERLNAGAYRAHSVRPTKI